MHVSRTALILAVGTALKVHSKERDIGLVSLGTELRVRATGDLSVDLPVPSTELFAAPAGGQGAKLPGAALLNFLRRSAADDVLIEWAGAAVKVTCNRVTATFTSTGDAPPIPSAPSVLVGHVRAHSLLQALSRVRHSASQRADSHGAYRGVLIETTGAVMRVVTTDGAALALCGVAWQGQDTRVLVRLADVAPVMAVLAAEGEEHVALHVSEKELRIEGRAIARLRLMEEKAFPNVYALIPPGSNPDLRVEGDALRAALTSAATVLGGRPGGMITLRSGDGEAHLFTQADGARASVSFPCSVYRPVELTSLARLLVLAATESGPVSLFAPPDRPVVMMRSGAFLTLFSRHLTPQVTARPPRSPWEETVQAGPVLDVPWSTVGAG